MVCKTLQVPLTLPDDPHGPATFIHTIEERLANQPGIKRVSVSANGESDAPRQGQIHLEYDPDLLSLAQVNRCIEQAGGSIKESVGHLVLPITGVLTPQSERVVQAVLNKLPGVMASVSFGSQTVRIEFDRSRCALPEIVRRLDHMGIRVGHDVAGGVKAEGEKKQALSIPACCQRAVSHRDLVLAGVGGVFLLAGLVVNLWGGAQWLRLSLLAVSYVCCGWYTVPEMLKALRQLRLDIDLLMLAAAGGAAYLGHYEEGALLLLLFSLGNAGQRLAMSRARGAIKALAELSPQTAIRVDGDGEREVPVGDLKVGDLVLVRPGQRTPADGTVDSGQSAVDQAPITGESMPVDKSPGDGVFAGCINGDGALTVRVTKPSHENTIAKVIKLVEEAQSTKSPTQLFTDKVERWYVPFVLAATAGLVVVPPMAGIAPAREASIWAGWFYQAMAFLTAASPCALAIGTPAAVLSGIGHAARTGVLIKGGAHLENLGRVAVVAFDKTGTLTPGKPVVTDVVSLVDDMDELKILTIASAVERGSQHPLALTVVAEAKARGCAQVMAEEVRQVQGMGIEGRVEGRHVMIGRPAMLEGLTGRADSPVFERVQSLQDQGKTAMIVAVDERAVGVIAMVDQPRSSAAGMVGRLKRMGIKHTVMLTGDNARTAQAIADSVGIDEVMAQLLPQEKLEAVRRLDERYGRVAMVGDGVNDAPAMAAATVGVAVSGAAGGGSDVALETADVALLADDLTKLPDAIGMARFTRRVIAQNLALALGVIFVLAPMAAMGYTTIYAAVMFHEGSTVVVVLNALRILGFRMDRSPEG